MRDELGDRPPPNTHDLRHDLRHDSTWYWRDRAVQDSGIDVAEAKGDTAASKPCGDEPSIDESGTLGNDDDSHGSDCEDGNSYKLGDQEVGHSFATVGKFLARFYCQDSREYWHTVNMLSSQQLGSARRAELPSGRSAGMTGCVLCFG